MPFLDPNYVSSSSSSSSSKLALKKTGNEWTALAHIVTAVIGSGVLSLARSMAQLGWIAGPLTMLLFACVTLTSAFLLCNCYKSPDPETGPDRNGCYLDAVQKFLRENFKLRNAWFCGIIVRVNFIKVAIVYTITSSISIQYVDDIFDTKIKLLSYCYHDQGHDATCGYGSTRYMVIFGLIQVIVSQIPDFQSMKWLTVVATVMSFTYSIIGSAVGLAKVIENGEIKGSIRGLPSSTAAEKVWLVAQALGDIAFAFPFSLILLEVQDTLKASPPEKITMKKVSIMAVCVSTFSIFSVGILVIFSQPVFADIERWFARKFPESKFVHKNQSLKAPLMLPLELNFMRLFFGTAYVALVTGIAVLFPYFNQVVGVSGAVTFWPIVVYFPVEIYLTQKRSESWKSKGIALRVL
ncbi:unnamed protein product [Withania somnifera]